jgi:hypothetical protein
MRKGQGEPPEAGAERAQFCISTNWRGLQLDALFEGAHS